MTLRALKTLPGLASNASRGLIRGSLADDVLRYDGITLIDPFTSRISRA